MTQHQDYSANPFAEFASFANTSNSAQPSIYLSKYQSEQWSQLRAIAADADLLEVRYEDWAFKQFRAKLQFQQRGCQAYDISVDVNQLTRWATAHNLPINKQTRQQYLAELAANKSPYDWPLLITKLLLLPIIWPTNYIRRQWKLFNNKRKLADIGFRVAFETEVIWQANNLERYKLAVKQYAPDMYQPGTIWPFSTNKFQALFEHPEIKAMFADETMKVRYPFLLAQKFFQWVSNRMQRDQLQIKNLLHQPAIKTALCARLNADDDLAAICKAVTSVFVEQILSANADITPSEAYFACCAYWIKINGIEQYCNSHSINSILEQ